MELLQRYCAKFSLMPMMEGTCTPSCWERQRFYRIGGSCAVLMHIHGSMHETYTSWYIYSFMPWHAWWIYPCGLSWSPGCNPV